MTTPRVTHCPHCNTSFRITTAQLNAANGSVRCGSCLRVFDARPQTASKPNATRQPSTEPEQSTQKHTHAPPHPEPSKDIHYDGDHHQGDQNQKIDHLLDDLEPPEPPQPISADNWTGSLPWGIGVLLLSGFLLLQYAWFNRNSLSLNPGLRPVYEQACQLLSCTLPPLVDINAIKSMQLIVRSHPDFSNVLQVDAVIINNAGHSQPYPDLQLIFTDINDRLLASRTFRPTEYLGGELAGSKAMPAGQPIRLGLEIIDPGADAVNYRLTFSPGNPL
ncbi:MAG: DUF3426 domain-containing protein [Endozoicomonas sp.]